MAKHTCARCDRPINDNIVWYNPVGSPGPTADRIDSHTIQLWGIASPEPRSAGDAPYHKACFEEMTGQKLSPSK